MGASVIDLCAVSIIRDVIPTFIKVLDISYSSHFPIAIKISPNEHTSREEFIKIQKIVWEPSKINQFREQLEFLPKSRDKSIQTILQNIINSDQNCGMIKQRDLNGKLLVKGAV
jgi:hypothetical protein